MTQTEGFFMSKTDLIRFEVIEAFRGGKITRSQAAETLELSQRQVSRLAQKSRVAGLEGIVHKNRGREPRNKLSPSRREFYLQLYKTKYARFNFKHAWEWIHSKESIAENDRISYESFRTLCRKAGLGKVRQRRPSKARILRERVAHEGAVLQMDGSHHVWYGKNEECLIALIDDATSKIPSALFSESESTWACIRALRHVVERHGIPGVIITDQAGWAGHGLKRPNFSQFGRICDELGIVLVRTSTAQAKGRVERLFRTTQDRLVAELAFHDVQTRTHANQYLQQRFLPSWDQQFTVEAQSNVKRYRPVPSHIDLAQVFCIKHRRTIARNQVVNFNNRHFRINDRQWGSLWRREVIIHESETGDISFFLGERRLEVEEIIMDGRRVKAIRKISA